MKAYKFQFDGLALGGELVVVAGSEKTARTAALEALGKNACAQDADESLELKSVTPVLSRGATLVHFDNGDY